VLHPAFSPLLTAGNASMTGESGDHGQLLSWPAANPGCAAASAASAGSAAALAGWPATLA